MKTTVRVCLLCAGLVAGAGAQTPPKQVSVWLMPVENAGPNAIAQGENIPSELDRLRTSLAKTRVRLLNVEDPLAMKARSWNPEFNVPNFQVIASQSKTLAALQRFAEGHKVDLVVRFVTWDEAFGLLSADRAAGPDLLPDVAQIGTSWRGYFGGKHRILSRPNWQRSRGNWRDVLGIPACVLPYTNDVRLLFYWKRMPSAPPNAPPLQLNGASWQAVLESLRDGAGMGDTVALATGVTLNLLHDYASLVWAGPNDKLMRTGLLGPSIDLAGKSAMTVPDYLVAHARIALGNGEYRRLISFPESSHEEVSRTFVNGGYRATLEPANFVGRWAEDFEERQRKRDQEKKPRQHFWDYAAAVVPPGSFKGGSELIVSEKTDVAELAFALADFLATDPEYTEVLAQAGQLPSGRPGYGIDALARSLGGGDEASSRSFSEAVQKAIDQGHEYPDSQDWPTTVENRAVLEKLQRVWRRMAVGDLEGMHQTASDVQWEINSRIYGPDRAWNAFVQSWPLLLIGALLLIGYAGWSYRQRSQSLRRLITLLHLYRASRHESLKTLGDNLTGLVSQRETGELNCDQLTEKVGQLAHHYTDRDKLGPYMTLLGEDLVSEIQGTPATATLSAIVDGAAKGARLHYQAVKLMANPDVSFASAGLESWVLGRYPSLAKVVLQEWFFNCLKAMRNDCKPITIAVENGAVTVRSAGHLSDEDFSAITGKPSRGKLKADAHGLVLIRDIAYYAFGKKVEVQHGDGTIRLSIRLPLTLRARNENA